MTQFVAVLSAAPRLSYHLQLLAPNLKFLDVVPEKDDVLANISKAEIIVADANLLIPYVDKLPKTKWIQLTWAGTNILMPHLQDKSIPYILTRYSGTTFGRAMSEYVVAQIYNYERDQSRQYENQKKAEWIVDGKIRDHRLIYDLTIGIMGLGQIGSYIAKVLKNLGAKVWGMTRTKPKEEIDYLDKHVTNESLVEILQNCDYIINVMPATNETQGMLNGDILKNCENKSSIFMNIGRGTIIKETDLVKAIENKWIAGAILDVFEEEPLPKSSKLWSMPQVTITPHMSGISRPEDVAKLFVNNYTKYVEGESMLNLLDLKKGY